MTGELTLKDVVGTWRLIRATAQDADGHLLAPPYGPIPMGRLILSPEGRMMAVVCDGRPTVPEGESRGYASYCGNFTISGNMLVTHVDAAAKAERIGGQQIRRMEKRDGQLVMIPPRRADGSQRELFWSLDGPA